MYSIADVEQIVERCKKEKVDGVLSFCIDLAQKPSVFFETKDEAF